MNNSFPKELRLLKKGDFQNLRENPHFASSGLFLFFHKPNLLNRKETRLGISVSKKISKKAVDRNSFKRRIREAFRKSEFKDLAKDVLIVVNKKKLGKLENDLSRVETDLLRGFEKIRNS